MRDSLRIVDDTNSSTMKYLPSTLPVLVMLFSDNSLYSRYAIPGWDGRACVFHLHGTYETKGLPYLTLRALNPSVHEQKIAEFLRKPGGIWRNGWYEHDDKRWFSDFSSVRNSSLGIMARDFDMLALALHLSCSSDLGSLKVSKHKLSKGLAQSEKQDVPSILSSCELVRLGYLVLHGDTASDGVSRGA